MRKDVVSEVEDDFTQISLEEAKEMMLTEDGDVVEFQVTPKTSKNSCSDCEAGCVNE